MPGARNRSRNSEPDNPRTDHQNLHETPTPELPDQSAVIGGSVYVSSDWYRDNAAGSRRQAVTETEKGGGAAALLDLNHC
jgi:hypothetical protein